LEISLPNNNLLGPIPNFSNFPNLQMLSLERNQLTGEIPNFNLPNLKGLYLFDNQLIGTIPNFINLRNLEWLNLEWNQLTGEIPDFNNLHNILIIKIVEGNQFKMYIVSRLSAVIF